MNYASPLVNFDVSIGESSKQNHSIDKTIQFGLLNKSNIIDTVQLNNCVAVNSCMDSKPMTSLNLSASQSNKFGYTHQLQVSIGIYTPL